MEGGCCSSWDDVKLSPLTCMSLAMGLAFVRGIGFGFVVSIRCIYCHFLLLFTIGTICTVFLFVPRVSVLADLVFAPGHMSHLHCRY